MPTETYDLTTPQRLGLAAQAFSSTLAGKDGLAEAMAMADQMVEKKKTASREKASRELLGRILAGEDPGKIAREMQGNPAVDPSLLATFANEQMRVRESERQRRVTNEDQVAREGRATRAQIDTEGRDAAAAEKTEKRKAAQARLEELFKQELEQQAATTRSRAAVIDSPLPAAPGPGQAAPAGTSWIERAAERARTQRETEQQARQELAGMTPGLDLAREENRLFRLKEQEAESKISDRGADNQAAGLRLGILEENLKIQQARAAAGDEIARARAEKLAAEVTQLRLQMEREKNVAAYQALLAANGGRIPPGTSPDLLNVPPSVANTGLSGTAGGARADAGIEARRTNLRLTAVNARLGEIRAKYKAGVPPEQERTVRAEVETLMREKKALEGGR